MAAPSVTHVFETAELVEMILLDSEINMTQLFLLQRVNKQVKGVIEGSRKLRVKMFLQHSSEKVSAEDLHAADVAGEVDAEATALYNPLMGISPSPLDETIQLSTFRRFDFAPMSGVVAPGCWLGLLCPRPKIGPAPVDKRLKPVLGGSWEKLEVSRVPLDLSIQFHTGGPSHTPVGFFTMREMFTLGKDATLGEFVDMLGAWYRDYFTEHMDQNSFLRRFEEAESETSVSWARSSRFLPVRWNNSWN